MSIGAIIVLSVGISLLFLGLCNLIYCIGRNGVIPYFLGLFIVGFMVLGCSILTNQIDKELAKKLPITTYELKLSEGETKIEAGKKQLVNIKTREKDLTDDIVKLLDKVENYEKLIKDSSGNKKLMNRYAMSVLSYTKQKDKLIEQLNNTKVIYDEFLVKIDEAEFNLDDARNRLDFLKLELDNSNTEVDLSELDIKMPDFSDFELSEKELTHRINSNKAKLEVSNDLSLKVVVDNSKELEEIIGKALAK